ncbi:amidoligase family protein [Paenibacillus allorhizosphaerae]|uniref:Amidoligase n=1 Tax=Paenibacillus allorhizosphaerae TaxID=2849866 RepID=A0ABN7TS62_9BACL|nr:amidoligase family protein [Paenibacillus allorhizosphaerae]CAG7653613.1 hypothetical protein PAECIP111802_05537 [Paenibacillus allorhizosphaerae]
MWPSEVKWNELQFGVEIEFVGGAPEEVELLPGWIMALDEQQTDEAGRESGSELKPPPIRWEQREQIREMLNRLKAQNTQANWSCGLHVHVGLEKWDEAIVKPLLEASLLYQDALRSILQTSEHRLIFCPPVTQEMLERFEASPGPHALRHRGRPQSHRCGINAASWFDWGTVEIRYANGSLDYEEVIRTIELCLRFVAAVGAGRKLPSEPSELASALGAPAGGYPPPAPAPQWHKERMWLEDALIPAIAPQVERLLPDSEILHILPVEGGILVAAEKPDGTLSKFIFRPSVSGWAHVRSIQD